MTARFRAEPEASAELSEAALWYERQRNGLGREFLEAIDTALEFVACPATIISVQPRGGLAVHRKVLER